MVAMTGQWWLDVRKPKMEEVAAHLINLAWNGLSQLETQAADLQPRSSAPRPGRDPAGGRSRRSGLDPGHHEHAPERQHRPVRRRRVGRRGSGPGTGPGTPPPVPGRQGGEHRAQPAAAVPVAPPRPRRAARAGRWSPTRPPRSPPRPAGPGSRAGSPACRFSWAPSSSGCHAVRLASSRRMAWLGWSKLPGSWKASQPPGASQRTHSVSRSSWPGDPLQHGVT